MAHRTDGIRDGAVDAGLVGDVHRDGCRADLSGGLLRAVDVDVGNRDLRALCHAMGVEHPSLIRLDQIAIRSTDGHLIDAAEAFGLNADWFDDDRRSRLRGVLVG